MIIKLNKNDLEVVEQFASARETQDAGFYHKARGAFKRDDIIVGGLGELGAWRHLKKLGHVGIDTPDFRMYKRGAKSFKADMYDPVSGAHYHVKSQDITSAERYGNSYLCQKRDKLVQEPNPNDFIICTLVNKDRLEVEIVAELPAVDIKWSVPKIKWLRRTKVALYIKDQKVY